MQILVARGDEVGGQANLMARISGVTAAGNKPANSRDVRILSFVGSAQNGRSGRHRSVFGIDASRSELCTAETEQSRVLDRNIACTCRGTAIRQGEQFGGGLHQETGLARQEGVSE